MSTMSQLGEFLATIQNKQDARTVALEARLAELESKEECGCAETITALEERLATLESKEECGCAETITALEERLATLESKEECGCAETIATLEERLATLESKEECGCGSYDELLASYEERISALEGNTGGSTEGEGGEEGGSTEGEGEGENGGNTEGEGGEGGSTEGEGGDSGSTEGEGEGGSTEGEGGDSGSTEGEGENNIPTSITYDDVLFGIRIYNGEMYVAPIADSNTSFRYRKGSSSAVNGTLSNCFEVSTLGYSNGTKYYISKTGHIYDQLSADGEKYMSNIKITSETFFSVNGQNYSVAPVSGQEYPFVFTLNTPEV